MSVQGIGAGSASLLATGSGRFSLPGAEEFGQSLNLGQIIKGKVLRQYEGNRYLVSFDGRERVVDSGIPLTTGELIHGRVVALGDKVELQHVYSEQVTDKEDVSSNAANPELRRIDRREQWLQDLMSRYQAQLSAEDRVVISQVTRSVDDPSALGMVGVALGKLGLQQTPELLLGVYELLKRTNVVQQDVAKSIVAGGAVPAQSVATSLSSVRQLADELAKALGQSETEQDKLGAGALPEGSTNDSNMALAVQPRVIKQIRDDDARQRAEQAAWRAVNAQTSGTVAHRAGMLPLLIGEQLVEVSVALFEQRRDADQQPEAKHRQIVFALRTERLGAVEIKARLSGERVCIRIVAEDESKAQQMAGYAGQLRTLLVQGGWKVDEVVYESRGEAEERNAAVESVIEHIASQDSLSRLA